MRIDELFTPFFSKLNMQLNLNLSKIMQLQNRRLFLWLPIFFAIGIGGYFRTNIDLTLFESVSGLGGAVSLFGICLRFFKQGWGRFLLFAALLMICGYLMAQIRVDYVKANILSKAINHAQITGKIVNIEEFPNRIRLKLTDVTIQNKTLKSLPDFIRLSVALRNVKEKLQINQVIKTRANLTPPTMQSIPGIFNFSRYLWFKQIGATGYVTDNLQLIANGEEDALTFSAFINQTRHFLTQSFGSESWVGLQFAPEGELEALRVALITGNRTQIPEQEYDVIRDAGLAHLLAISGLHVGIISFISFSLLRIFFAFIPHISLNFNTKKIAATLTILIAFFYMLIAGGTIPTQRAFMMVSLVFIGILLDRNVISLYTVAIAAFIILGLFPESLLSAGFQLSFAAVTGLIAFYETSFAKHYLHMLQHRMYLRVINYILSLMMTTLIATMITAPFTLYHFGNIAVYGVISNLIAIPLMGVIIMPGALLSFLLLPFGFEELGLNLMDLGLVAVYKVALFVTDLPNATYHPAALSDFDFFLIVITLLWVLLWRGWLRFASIPVAFICGLFFWQEIQYEIFISSKGTLSAVHMPPSSPIFIGSRREKFIRNIWKDELGVPEEKQYKSHFIETQYSNDRLNCRMDSCFLKTKEENIFISFFKEHIGEACHYADYVIYPNGFMNCAPFLKSKGDNAHPPYEIDKYNLIRLGGVRLTKYKHQANLEVNYVYYENLNKPWNRLKGL